MERIENLKETSFSKRRNLDDKVKYLGMGERAELEGERSF